MTFEILHTQARVKTYPLPHPPDNMWLSHYTILSILAPTSPLIPTAFLPEMIHVVNSCLSFNTLL